MKVLRALVIAVILLISSGWGFYAHQRINRIAVFTLPMEMSGFYKRNIQYITEKAVNPDKRRYIMKEEAPRHYIDLEAYGDSALYKLPRYWSQAVEQFSEDTLMAYGIVPWHINRVEYQLTQAFIRRDEAAILKYSTDLGHYIADAHVPLHTTMNYNGQFTGQFGIHGFWESRLPELFFDDYDLFSGQARYIENTQMEAWKAVESAHNALDSVFYLERLLSEEFPGDKKYSYEERGSAIVRVYSFDFSERYHELMNGMVERQMRSAIRMIGDFWFTAWVDAGQPDLDALVMPDILPEPEIAASSADSLHLRNHESGEAGW